MGKPARNRFIVKCIFHAIEEEGDSEYTLIERVLQYGKSSNISRAEVQEILSKIDLISDKD